MARTPQWQLKAHRSWHNISEFFAYDVWDPIKTFFYDIGWFFHNIKVFWNTLRYFRDWDYVYVVDLFKVGLIELANRIENGNEERVSAMKKVVAIHKLLDELNRDLDAEVDDMQEKGIISRFEGGLAYDRVFAERMNNVFRLIKGQKDDEFAKQYQQAQEDWKKEHGREPNSSELYDIWASLFDGSGIDGWWE